MDLALIASAVFLSGKILNKPSVTVNEHAPTPHAIPLEQDETTELLTVCAPKSVPLRKRKMSFYETRPEAEGFAPIAADETLGHVEFGRNERTRMKTQLSERVSSMTDTIQDKPLAEDAFRLKPKCSEQLYGDSAKTSEEYKRSNNGHVYKIKAPHIATPEFRAPRINQDLTHLSVVTPIAQGGETARTAVDTSDLLNKILYKRRANRTGNIFVSDGGSGETTRNKRKNIEYDAYDRVMPQPELQAMPDYDGIFEHPPSLPQTLENRCTNWVSGDQKERAKLGQVIKTARKDEDLVGRFGHAQGRHNYSDTSIIPKQSLDTTRKEHALRQIIGQIHGKHKSAELTEYQLRNTKKSDKLKERQGVRTRAILAGTIDNETTNQPLKKGRKIDMIQNTLRNGGTTVSASVLRGSASRDKKTREVAYKEPIKTHRTRALNTIHDNLQKGSKVEKRGRQPLAATLPTLKRRI